MLGKAIIAVFSLMDRPEQANPTLWLDMDLWACIKKTRAGVLKFRCIRKWGLLYVIKKKKKQNC